MDIQIIRIRRWQCVARSPEHHAQLLASVFGPMLCETTQNLEFSWAPVRHNGEGSHKTNPWRKQFLEDMQLLNVFADGRACLDVIGDDLLDIFRPTPGRHVFVKLTIARVRKWWLEQPAPACRVPDATVSWCSPTRVACSVRMVRYVCLLQIQNKRFECTKL